MNTSDATTADGRALIGIVTNPNSQKNRAQPGRAARLDALVRGIGLVRQTPSVVGLGAVADELRARGVRYWVCDGGDGTFHWLLNALRGQIGDAGLTGDDAPVFVPTNSGTIDFVARKAGIHGRADDVIGALAARLRAGERPARVALPTLDVDDAGTFRRLGFAVTLGGIGQRFFTTYYAEPSRGSGTILRLVGKTVLGIAAELPGVHRLPRMRALRDHARFVLEGTRATVTADGRRFDFPRLMGLYAGSIDMNLGGIRLFPYSAQPGALHMVVGGQLPLREAWYKWVWLLAGRPVPSDVWHEFPGRHLEVLPAAGEQLDPVIDGEVFSGLNRAEVVPGPRVQVLRGTGSS